MKTIQTPQDFHKYTVPPMGDRKQMKIRAKAIRFRIGKMVCARRVVEKVWEAFDRAIGKDFERLEETEEEGGLR